MSPHIDATPPAHLDPDLKQKIEEATLVLERVIGPTAGLVAVSWTVHLDGRGRIAVDLDLKDLTSPSTASCSFYSEDFGHPERLRSHFHQVWGNLLQTRLDYINKDLRSIVAGGLAE